MKIVKKNIDLFGIILGTSMIIGTFLPYLTYWGNEARLIGTRYGTIVIISGIITIILGISSSGIRVGYLVSGLVSLAGWYNGGAYYSEVLREYNDLGSLINDGNGSYVILFSSAFTVLAGLYAIYKAIKGATYEDYKEKER
ncbi:MAG: hypothetical protein K6B41_11075 [Butyrivibrio sp.]|nr:hypothetical protein [Butyrivibrio sp.]